LDSDKPVSRQFEEAYYGYYGWPTYWGGPYMWGRLSLTLCVTVKNGKNTPKGEKAWDPHLRSTHDVSGHHIQAADGEIGHVEDFIIDDETWAIRYLIIDTRNWWPGKKVLVSPQWIESVSWSESKVFVNLSRETIKQSPEYTEESLLTRDYETGCIDITIARDTGSMNRCYAPRETTSPKFASSILSRDLVRFYSGQSGHPVT
jgi:hypothetical protein